MIRRDFLSGIFAACTAPAIVRAESIMVVRRPIEMPGDRWHVQFDWTKHGWFVIEDAGLRHPVSIDYWKPTAISGNVYHYRNMEDTKNAIVARISRT